MIFFDATTKLETPAFVGFIAGKASDQWNAKTENQIKEAALHQLASYFGRDKVQRNFVRFIMKSWTEEDNIGGGPVNYLPPGELQLDALVDTCEYFVNTEGIVWGCGDTLGILSRYFVLEYIADIEGILRGY